MVGWRTRIRIFESNPSERSRRKWIYSWHSDSGSEVGIIREKWTGSLVRWFEIRDHYFIAIPKIEIENKWAFMFLSLSSHVLSHFSPYLVHVSCLVPSPSPSLGSFTWIVIFQLISPPPCRHVDVIILHISFCRGFVSLSPSLRA